MNYNQGTIDQIDEKLERELREHQRRIKIYIIIGVFFFLFLFRGTISFWLKFAIAIPSGYDSTRIDVTSEPVQINYSDAKKQLRQFEYKSLLNGNQIQIYPQAKYKISGLVVAYNKYFIFRNEFFDSAALYDIGLGWGKLGEKNFYNKYFESYSQKNELTGARVLFTRAKTRNLPVGMDYAKNHFSHSHIVPANRNIMAALLHIRKWDNVEIEGELVDMRYRNKSGREEYYSTSLSRDDGGARGDRGNGSCETIFVTKVKNGHFIYK